MVKRLLALLLCALGVAAGESKAVPGYRLFAGDLVRIEVYGHPDLLLETRLAAGGELAYPLIGALGQVVGRSPEEVAAEITRRLADGYIRNPSVQVLVQAFGARTAWVVGAVKSPGTVNLDPLRPASAQQAIGSAGGFDEDADRAAAQVMRDDPARPGGKIALPLPALDAPQQDVQLMHGDVVVVPKADRIFVLGQVQYPRAIPLPAREVLTVSKAISLAGGFGRYAKDSKVQLVRRGAQPQIVDVRAALDGEKDAVDPELRAGDTVFVPESRF